jgi:hypothetical protein
MLQGIGISEKKVYQFNNKTTFKKTLHSDNQNIGGIYELYMAQYYRRNGLLAAAPNGLLPVWQGEDRR